MKQITSIFTPSFDNFVNKFFPDKTLQERIYAELLKYIQQPRDLPAPASCETRGSRKKEWLKDTDVFVYYWDYGRVWEFYGIVEAENRNQLDELEQALEDESYLERT